MWFCVEYSGLPGGSGSMFAFLRVKGNKNNPTSCWAQFAKGCANCRESSPKIPPNRTNRTNRKAYSALEWVINVISHQAKREMIIAYHHKSFQNHWCFCWLSDELHLGLPWRRVPSLNYTKLAEGWSCDVASLVRLYWVTLPSNRYNRWMFYLLKSVDSSQLLAFKT